MCCSFGGNFGNGFVTDQNGIACHQNLGFPTPRAAGPFPAPLYRAFPNASWCSFAPAICFGKSLTKEIKRNGFLANKFSASTQVLRSQQPGLSSETGCFGESAAGRGLSLAQGVSAGAAAAHGGTPSRPPVSSTTASPC